MLCLVLKNTIAQIVEQPFEVIGCVRANDGTIVIGAENSTNAWREVPQERAVVGWVFNSATGQFCDPDELKDIEELRAEKLAEIEAAANKAHDDATADYSAYELKSFDEQEAAAKRGANDALIIELAAAREQEAGAVVSNIINKADLLRARYGQIIGRQRVLGDAAKAATTREELAAIQIEL